MRALAVLSLSVLASAGPVVKREGLGEPRKRLLYRGRVGEKEPLRLVMWQEFQRTDEERGESRKQESPRIALDLEIAPERFVRGVTFFRVRVAGAEASGTAGDQLRRAVRALKGLVGHGAVAEDGSGTDLRWEGMERLPPISEPVAEEARAMLAGAFAPLPPDPLGEGGQWAVLGSGEAVPGEPRIAETLFTCSVVGDGAVITAAGAAEATVATKVAGGGDARDRVAVEVRSRSRIRPLRLFPTQEATRTVAVHYRSGVVDRQSWELRLEGPAEPEPRAITITARGDEPRVAIEYPATVRPRRYAIEYLAHETESNEGHVSKSGEPRVRVVVRVQERAQTEPRFSDGCVIQWTVEEAKVVGDAPGSLAGLVGLGGGGAYGRACDPIVGYAGGTLRTRRARMEPDVWLELPDGVAPEVEREAARLCEAVEGSMLLLPEKRFEAPEDEHGDVAVLLPRLGKGGAWRHADRLAVPGLKPVTRVVECTVAAVDDESFTVTCRADDALEELGPVGEGAQLRVLKARRRGSWTIARGHPMPLRANVEDVIDREVEVTSPDGSAKTVRFHGVRSFTIEALD